MQAKLYHQTPPALLVLAAFVFLFLLLCRESSTLDDLPAFLPLSDNYFYVELSGEIDSPGVYQINDGLLPAAVINLTSKDVDESFFGPLEWAHPLQDGENIEIIEKEHSSSRLRRSRSMRWLSVPPDTTRSPPAWSVPASACAFLMT